LLAGCSGSPSDQASGRSSTTGVTTATGGCGASCAQAGAGGGPPPQFRGKGSSGSNVTTTTTAGSQLYSNESFSVALPQGWTTAGSYSQTSMNFDGPNGIYVDLYGDIFRASGYTLNQYFSYRLSQFQQGESGAHLCGQASRVTLPGTTISGGKSINICYSFRPSGSSPIAIELTQQAALVADRSGTFDDQIIVTVGVGAPASLAPSYVDAVVAPVLDSIHWSSADLLR